jgi:flagellar motor switch protein FliG
MINIQTVMYVIKRRKIMKKTKEDSLQTKQLVAYKIFRFNHIIFLQDISINKANDLADDKNSDV